MNSALPKQFSRHLRQGSLLLALGMTLTGCSTLPPGAPAPETAYRPDNVYVAGSALPEQVRRVAVLPVTADENYSVLRDGCDALEPVLNAELIKTKKFETVRVTSEDLRSCTGRMAWTAEENLPAEMFKALQETYGCDAVLFSQLTVFRASPPLAIGWRMKLVDANSGQILWASDEVFDAGKHTAQTPVWPWTFPVLKQPSAEELANDWRMENSPRLFGQYTLAQLLATLPAR
jgi:hypothetical protein